MTGWHPFAHLQQIRTSSIELEMDPIHQGSHQVEAKPTRSTLFHRRCKVGARYSIRIKGCTSVLEANDELIVGQLCSDCNRAFQTMVAIGMHDDVRRRFIHSKLHLPDSVIVEAGGTRR